MKWPVLLVLLLVSLVANGGFMIHSWRAATVVSVPDGDSLQLRDGRRVRLLGIDAPEKGRCMSNEARELLRYLARGKHVRLKDIVTDDYGRVLAIVIIEDFPTWISYLTRWVKERVARIGGPPAAGVPLVGGAGGKSATGPAPDIVDPLINRVMLASGLARSTASATGEYAATLKAAHESAKDKKLGIYSEQCRSDTPADDCRIKGNIREGNPVYYLPTCKYYDQVIVDEAFGDAWFCSEKEAKAAGFTFAPSCK